MGIENEESYCLFQNTNGSSTGKVGGATKQWLNDNDGDPSKLFNDMSSNDYTPVIALTSAAYSTDDGIVVRNVGDFTGAEVGMVVYVFDTVGGIFNTGRYKIIAVDIDGEYIQIADGQGTTLSDDVDVYVGGAFDDMQDALDEADAGYFNCWIFSNSDYATAAAPDWDITPPLAGEYVNNTNLYIVGYKTNAYDALPAGRGYFPNSIGDGSGYKSGFTRGKLSQTDIQIATDLTKIDVLGYSASEAIFQLSGMCENVVIMGFAFQGLGDYIRCTNVAGDSASLEVRHCTASAYLYDSSPRTNYNAFLTYNSGGPDNVIIEDCYTKCVSSSYHAGNTYDPRLNIEVHNNFFLDQNNVAYKFCIADLHHNIFVDQAGQGGNRALSVVDAAQVKAYNNTIYGARYKAFVNLHCGNDPARFLCYNNILFVDPDIFEGVLNLNDGGTVVQFDHNLYFGTDGNPLTFINDVGVNSNWLYPEKGAHDIEAEPLFADAANYNFRPRNPAVITGGRPVNGVATYIGAIPPKYNFKTNARAASFGRGGIVKN